MSYSDDTDELLIIPPDFFLVESDSENIISNVSSNGPYYNVVNRLIAHVYSLERKVNSIAEFNFSSLSTDENTKSYMTHNRKFNSAEDLQKKYKSSSFWSTHSTPSKLQDNTVEKEFLDFRKVNQELPTKNVQFFQKTIHNTNEASSTKKESITDIGDFIGCVKKIQMLKDFNIEEKLNSKAENDLEFFKMPAEIHRKSCKHDLFPTNADSYDKVCAWHLYPEKLIQDCNSIQIPQKSNDFEKKFYKKEQEEEEQASNREGEFVSSGQVPEEINNYNHQIPKHNNPLAFLSLNDLWNTAKKKIDHNFCEGDIFLLKKLEEEKLMRKYCEQVVQQQQKHILDMEERLSVAVQVDEAKDETIKSFFDKWYKMQDKIKSMEDDVKMYRNKLEMTQEEKKTCLDEYMEKLKFLEDETSNAATLARANQEKVTNLEKENLDLRIKLESNEEKFKNIDMLFMSEKKKNQHLLNLIESRGNEFSEAKKHLSEKQKEIEMQKKAMEKCEEEVTNVKKSINDLQRQLDDEKEWNKDFELQKKKLFEEIESHVKTKNSLQEEIERLKKSNERTKVELRNFYQGQVETVVQEKLKEFQGQLEKAENNLQFELRSQEKSFAKAAATHIFQLTEKHNMEVQLLEERHREEVRLHKLQLSQARQQLEACRTKLQSQQERIVEQLYRAMEAQWMEALKVIGGGGSDDSNKNMSSSIDDKKGMAETGTNEKTLNYLKSRSYNSFERILSENVDRVFGNDRDNDDDDDDNNDDRVTTDVRHVENYDNDHPHNERTNRTLKSKQEIEKELHKYIQNLNNSEQKPSIISEKMKTFTFLPQQQINNCEEYHEAVMNKGAPSRTQISRESKQLKRPWK